METKEINRFCENLDLKLSKRLIQEIRKDERKKTLKWLLEVLNNYYDGYDDAKKEYESDLLSKSNHILGCMLEGFENVLRYRNLNKEADLLSEVASRIK